MDAKHVLRELEKSTIGVVRVWCFEFPAGEPTRSQMPSAEQSEDPYEIVDGISTKQPSELNAALALARAASDLRLSPIEWVERIPSLIERELVRAIKFGAICSEARGEGKGHAAKVIPADELVAYLAICDDVVSGRGAPPQWWWNVRKGGRAVIRGEVDDAA